MATFLKILATEDPEDTRRYILRKLGLFETMCFTSSNSQERWFIEHNNLFYMAKDSDGLCEAVNIYKIGLSR